MRVQEKLSRFVRCSNAQDVPESFCLSCLRTLVAPSVHGLEKLEQAHQCPNGENHRSRDAMPVSRYQHQFSIR